MKLCFHHELFDDDVSSGTIHALYQWFELCHAFDVCEVAIINLSGDEIPLIDSLMQVNEFPDLEKFIDFTNRHGDRLTYVEMGGPNFKCYDFSCTDWLIIGGVKGLQVSDVSLPSTRVALYPREAAAIVLAEALWQ